MAESNEELLFTEAFCARTQALRKSKGADWTAERMAMVLGIPPDRYRKYETRTPMPHYLIPRFAALVDRTIEFVMTGKDMKQYDLAASIRKIKA